MVWSKLIPMAGKIDSEQALKLLSAFQAGAELTPAELALTVRFTLAEFAKRHPGRSVEIRIPWIGAVQAIAGVNHRRGTPPNVVEMSGNTWLTLVTTGLVD